MLSAKYIRQGHVLDQTYLYACWIILMRHYWQTLIWNAKRVAKKAFNIGEVWNLVCCHRTTRRTLYCEAPTCIVESYCKESHSSVANWLRYPCLSYLSKIWLSVLHNHLVALHILKTWTSLEWIEIFENSKQHFSSRTDYFFGSYKA